MRLPPAAARRAAQLPADGLLPRACFHCAEPRSSAGLVTGESARPQASSVAPAAVPMKARREKVFGPGRAVPLDRNAKARIAAYARAWDRRHRQPGQRGGALGRAALDVLGALLWVFHNAGSGCCFPSYETIAAKSGCARSTVAEAIKALEFAGVLTWQNRITRIRERCRDLFGRDGWRWRVIRTSNAYVFQDPKEAVSAGFRSKSDQRTGTPNQEIPRYLRPVLRERIGAQSIAEMDRDAVASRDRQLQALKATMT